MLQIFDVTANETARYKCNELELGDNTFVIEWFAGINCIIYSRKFSFTATRQWSGKTGICNCKMKQFMPANYSNTNRVIITLIHSDKTFFQNVFVTLLRRIAKDVTSSLLSWHKCYEFNATNFRRHSQWKCVLQTQWIRILIYTFWNTWKLQAHYYYIYYAQQACM